MTINKEECILNTYDSNDQLVKNTKTVSYLIFPDEGKLLKNIKTGLVYTGGISVRDKQAISNFTEIAIAEDDE